MGTHSDSLRQKTEIDQLKIDLHSKSGEVHVYKDKITSVRLELDQKNSQLEQILIKLKAERSENIQT